MHASMYMCVYTYAELSRLMVVSRGTMKKQAIRNEQVSYLQVALL